MHYRKLDAGEVSRFAHAWETWTTWQEIAAYATDLYGPTAAGVAVEIEYAYDDMSAYFPSLADVTVTDAQGRQLDLDLRTAWWQAQLADVPADDDAERAYHIDDAIDERRYNLAVPAAATTWDLTHPPAVPFRELYVVEAGADT